MSTISPAPSESRLRVTHIPISEALRRYALVVALATLLLAGLGVAWGLYRAPIYTATSENVVRALSPSVAQLPGAIQAAQDLASNQSRLIDSDGIAGPVAERLDTTSAYVAAHVSATPVPDSTVIRVEAQGPSADAAIELANESARAFARYVNTQTTSDAEGTEILELYRAASAAYRRELAAQQGVDRAGDAASPATRLRVASAVDAAQLRRQALSAQYQTVIQSQGTAPTVRPFVIARTATSDRVPTAELLGFAGAVAGFVLGAALALLLANRRSRRRT